MCGLTPTPGGTPVWNSLDVAVLSSRGGGESFLPLRGEGTGARNIWMKPLKKTNLGVVWAFFERTLEYTTEKARLPAAV